MLLNHELHERSTKAARVETGAGFCAADARSLLALTRDALVSFRLYFRVFSVFRG
jgi:hypothetical protein